MPLFNPETDMDLSGDLDFDLYTPQEGYASARGLELGTSADGYQIPFRCVSQLEHASPQSTPPRSPPPRSSPHSAPQTRLAPPIPQLTATPAHAPSGLFSSPPTHGSAIDVGDRMDYTPTIGSLNNSLQFVDDDENDRSSHVEFAGVHLDRMNNAPAIGPFPNARQFVKGDDNDWSSHVEFADVHRDRITRGFRDRGDDDLVEPKPSKPRGAKKTTSTKRTIKKATKSIPTEPVEDALEEDQTVVQKVHKDRYQSDFGMLRLHLSEATVSFIRDEWAVLKDKGVPCFKPAGGAWKTNQRHKYGEGQVWINSDEATFRDALFWALGRDMPNRTPQCELKYRDSYTEGRVEKSHELERYLDAGRVEGMMDAAVMHSNRQARLRNLQQLIPRSPVGRPKRSLAQAIVNAIAGKHVDLDALGARIKDPAKFGHGPLPASMQVDPVYLQPGPATDKFIQKYLLDWMNEKRAADDSRKDAGRALASAAGAR
ncbi:hypothetical protein ACEPPN_015113 [Leptodophora sp. 'Broadleaf-Isolate-01']